MKALARLPLLQALSWFLYLGGWIVLGGLARMLTAGPWQALGLLLLWPLLLAVFAQLQPVAVAPGPAGRSRLMHCLKFSLRLSLTRFLPLLAALAAARGIAAALDGSGLQGLLLALPAWAWLSASAWSGARRAAAAVRPPARAQAAAAFAGAALLWLLAGDIADLRASCMRLAWAALAAGLVLALMPLASAAAAAATAAAAAAASAAPIPDAGARNGRRDRERAHGFPAIGCLGCGTERPGWPLTLASLAMLPMMCGLALWPELCGSDSLPADAALGLHLLAMFAPALLLSGARIELAPATPAACTALLMAAILALHWLPASLPQWALAWLPGIAWSLVWLASMRQRQKIPLRLAGPAEAP